MERELKEKLRWKFVSINPLYNDTEYLPGYGRIITDICEKEIYYQTIGFVELANIKKFENLLTYINGLREDSSFYERPDKEALEKELQDMIIYIK